MTTLLENFGITQVLCAAEIEFIPQELEKLSAAQKNFQIKKKKEFFDFLNNKNEHQRAEILQGFLPQEIMMFDLHEGDINTKDKLEFIFGTDRSDASYYDAVIGIMRCMEFKTKPIKITDFEANLDLLIKKLYEKAEQYGVKITDPKIQLNLSFWKNDINIFDSENVDFDKSAPKILTGIIENIYTRREELKFLYISATGAPPLLSLKAGRDGFSRLVGEGETSRLELRPSRTGASISQIDIKKFLEIIEEGAALGLQKSKHNLKKIKRCIFMRAGADLKMVTHVLLGARLKKNFLGGTYKIIPPENYISGWLYLNFAKIALELGFEPISPEVNQNQLKFLKKSRYDELISDYKNSERVRIDYLKQLKQKAKRNKLEDLEYNFLRQFYKKEKSFEKMAWPTQIEFYKHFKDLEQNSITLPEMLYLFNSIKISSGKELQIRIPEKNKKLLPAVKLIKEKIRAKKILNCYVMEETLPIV